MFIRNKIAKKRNKTTGFEKVGEKNQNLHCATLRKAAAGWQQNGFPGLLRASR